MPPKVKAVLSVLVAIVTATAVWYFAAAGNSVSQYVTLFLGAFMIVAMWVFPEVTRGGDGKHGARR